MENQGKKSFFDDFDYKDKGDSCLDDMSGDFMNNRMTIDELRRNVLGLCTSTTFSYSGALKSKDHYKVIEIINNHNIISDFLK